MRLGFTSMRFSACFQFCRNPLQSIEHSFLWATFTFVHFLPMRFLKRVRDFFPSRSRFWFLFPYTSIEIGESKTVLAFSMRFMRIKHGKNACEKMKRHLENASTCIGVNQAEEPHFNIMMPDRKPDICSVAFNAEQ